jgi:DNA-binding ferritin-like protein
MKDMAIDLLRHLLALLRAQYWMYQESHWKAQGIGGYGSHLLFQRIYDGDDDNEGEDDEGIQGEVDDLAEKMVGAYGNEAICTAVLIQRTAGWIARWSKVECLHARGLLSERDCQKVIKTTYDRLKAMGELSLGMDDFLMSLASAHETNQFLLRQVLRSREAAKAKE